MPTRDFQPMLVADFIRYLRRAGGILTRLAPRAWLLLAIGLVVDAECFADSFRHIHVVTSLEIDGRRFTVENRFHCENLFSGPNFGPGGLIQTEWRPYGYLNWLVIRLEDGSAVLVPGWQVCGATYQADWTARWINSVADPNWIESFGRGRLRGTRHEITSIQVNVDERPSEAPDTVQPADDAELWRRVFDPSRQFQRVTAFVSAESSLSEERKAAFATSAGVTVAPQGADGRGRFHFQAGPTQASVGSYRSASVEVPLVYDGAEWRPLDTPMKDSASMHRLLPLSTPGTQNVGSVNPTTVRYRGTAFPLNAEQEVFDAESRVFIRFVNDSGRPV